MDGKWLFKLDNRPGVQQRFERAATAGWKHGHRPQRVERRRQQPASLRRRRRLVSQGLQAAHAASGVVGRALRVGQLPLEGLAQRQADRQEPRRLPAVRDPPARRPAQARRRQPPGHPRRQPPQADRLPALGLRQWASRRAAGGTTAACCARSTCARSTTSTSTRSSRAPRSAVRHVRRDRQLPRDRPQLRLATPARQRQRALRRRAVAIGSAAIGAKRFATLTKQIKIDKPRLWSPAAPYLYDASMAGRSGGTLLQRYTLQTGIRSIKIVDGHLLLNGAPMNFRGVGAARGHPHDRASRSTTRPATSSWRGSRSWAPPSSARTTRWRRTRRSAPTSWGSCSGRRSRSTRSRPGTSSRSSCASSPPASSSRTSRPTATTPR